MTKNNTNSRNRRAVLKTIGAGGIATPFVGPSKAQKSSSAGRELDELVKLAEVQISAKFFTEKTDEASKIYQRHIDRMKPYGVVNNSIIINEKTVEKNLTTDGYNLGNIGPDGDLINDLSGPITPIASSKSVPTVITRDLRPTTVATVKNQQKSGKVTIKETSEDTLQAQYRGTSVEVPEGDHCVIEHTIPSVHVQTGRSASTENHDLNSEGRITPEAKREILNKPEKDRSQIDVMYEKQTMALNLHVVNHGSLSLKRMF
jgi:hypothetical protein